MTNTVSTVDALNVAVGGVLSRMATGVVMTLLTATVITTSGMVPVLFSGLLAWLVIFAPVAMSLYLAWRGDSLSVPALRTWFYAFAAAMGLSLSLMFAVFSLGSIVQALAVTTVSFVCLAAWGYLTKRDISGWGPFLFAGVIGLIVAGIVNVFVASTALQMTLNVITVLVFLGLTAYDINRIRDMFWQASDCEIERQQWFGALSLYINFINIFINLLQLLGNRDD